MLFLSHRGNISGPNPKSENKPSYIENALNQGFQVEIDIFYDKGWWSGHDKPQYKITKNLMKNCWCHAKNTEAFFRLQMVCCPNYFWQEDDKYSLTSSGAIWCHKKYPYESNKSIIMLNRNKNIPKLCYGIYSDWIGEYINKNDKFY